MNETLWRGIALGCVGALAVAVSAETLFVDYFDVPTGSGAGTEVTGRIHPRSNKDAHASDAADAYRFEITRDPSGLFSLSDARDSKGRLFGVITVAPGRTISATPTAYPLEIALTSDQGVIAATNLTINAVVKTAMDQVLEHLQRFPIDFNRLYGRQTYSDAEVASWLTELEATGGRFVGFDFYTNAVLSYDGDAGNLEYQWEEVATRIGGLGKAYHDSDVYGPAGNPTDRARLKDGLYAALERLLERIPVAGEDVLVEGEPISTVYGDGFMRLAKDVKVIGYSFTSHQWRLTDPLSGPALWLMADLRAEMAAGDARALALHEKLVNLFQLCFANPPGYQAIDDPEGRWGDLTDVNRTEGAFSDANLGHRMRGWLSLLGVWADYNRPITYVPYYYEGYHGSVEYMPGFSPRGVLKDLEFWINTFHRPAHVFEQSGFQPDGTVTHHLSDSSDIAMNAYGYGWLTEVIDPYNILKDAPVDLADAGYQFIADRFLHTYDRMVYRSYLDYTVSGRSYSAEDGTKLARGFPAMIDHLLDGKQIGTVISNETELIAWRDAIEDGTHEQSGNTAFWVGNYMVHRRGENGENPRFFSVKTRNDRTSGAEDFARVKKSWHAGSGVLQAMVRGDEYDQTRFNQDWHALPGVTEEWRTDAIVYDKTFLPGGSPFSGMVSDDRHGCAAMKHRSLAGSYSSADADKAWFFTETEAIALGAKVSRANAGQGAEIITTVDQTRWRGTTTYGLNGGAPTTLEIGTDPNLALSMTGPTWIHQGDIGYVVFPRGNQTLFVRGGSAVNVTDPDNATGIDVIHFAIGHGASPTNGAYHYVVVPHKTAGEMPAYLDALTNRVEIVETDGAFGARDAELDLAQVAFFEAGSVSFADGRVISADRPAMALLRGNGDRWTIAAADPLHELAATELVLTLNAPLKAGVYPYQLPGIHPRPGESVVIEPVEGGTRARFALPDPTDDPDYDYQAALYAGAPISISVPNDGPLAFTSTLFREDFETYSLDQPVPVGGRWSATSASEASGVYAHVRNDVGKRFGPGANNRYLGLLDAATNRSVNLVAEDAFETDLLRLSFDFAEPDNERAGSVSLRVGVGEVKKNNDEVVGGVRPVDGRLTPAGEYALDVARHVDIYFNESTNAISYIDPNGGLAALASGRFDLWLEGELVADDVVNDRYLASPLATMRSLRFETYTKSVSEVWFDNIEVAGAVSSAVSDPYASWAASRQLVGADAAGDADPDGDGRVNRFEYALGLDPLEANDAEKLPRWSVAGASAEFSFRRRTDAAERGLLYRVERSTNLLNAAWTTNGVVQAGVAPLESGFESVTNAVAIDAPVQHLRLRIESP